MSGLRPHILAARAYATAYSAQAYNIRRQMTVRADDGVMLLMKQMEAHAAAHSRAAEILEAEAAAIDAASAQAGRGEA